MLSSKVFQSEVLSTKLFLFVLKNTWFCLKNLHVIYYCNADKKLY